MAAPSGRPRFQGESSAPTSCSASVRNRLVSVRRPGLRDCCGPGAGLRAAVTQPGASPGAQGLRSKPPLKGAMSAQRQNWPSQFGGGGMSHWGLEKSHELQENPSTKQFGCKAITLGIKSDLLSVGYKSLQDLAPPPLCSSQRQSLLGLGCPATLAFFLFPRKLPLPSQFPLSLESFLSRRHSSRFLSNGPRAESLCQTSLVKAPPSTLSYCLVLFLHSLYQYLK